MKLIFTLALAITLYSCGKDDEQTPHLVVKKNRTGTPIFLESHHKLCRDSFDDKYLDNLNEITGVFNGIRTTVIPNRLEKRFQAFPELKSSSGANFLIKVTNGHELHLRRTLFVDENNEAYSQDEDSVIIRKGEATQICSSQDIPEDGLENMALNVVTSLDKVQLALNKINYQDKLAPVKVHLQPAVYKVDRLVKPSTSEEAIVKKVIQTDNAFYHKDEIYFLPDSKEWREKLGEFHTSLWESPFVVSHEYGHHIFKELAKKDLKLAHFHNGNCFQAASDKRTDDTSKLKSQTQKIGHLFRALNEGFADIFAYYTQGYATGTSKGIYCERINRNITYSVFGNRSSKRLTKEALSIYMRETKVERSRDCNVPDFTDEHTIGAIFAATMYKILNHTDLENSSQKIKVLLKWLESINENFDDYKNKEMNEVVQATMELFIEEVTRANGHSVPSSLHRAIIKANFPIL